MARGAAAILGALRRLQIGAKVPRAFDDLAADRQPLRLEAQKRRFHLIRVKGPGQRGRIVGRLGNARRHMRPRDERRIADDRHSPEGKTRALEIVDRLQHGLVDQPHDGAKLRR